MNAIVKDKFANGGRRSRGDLQPVQLNCAPGDVIVIVASQQNGDMPVPEFGSGWASKNAFVNNRAGYVAVKTVETPNDGKDLTWWNQGSGATDETRMNVLALVFSNIEAPEPIAWVKDKPPVVSYSLVLSQQHAMGNIRLDSWSADKIVHEGTDASTESWSSLRAALTSSDVSGGDSAQAWLVLPINVKADKELPHVHVKMEAGRILFDSLGRVEKVSMVPFGTLSVSALLSTPEFIVAHRGGSASWKEHTKEAYSGAVAHGVHALEFSANRTTDGIWWGLHDDDLSNFGGDATPAKTMSWAQISEVMGRQGIQPLKLDEFLSLYGHSHTLIFDPKTLAKDGQSEYFEFLKPFKDNLMLKFHGGAEWLFREWRAEGFYTWGYFYAVNKQEEWWDRAIHSNLFDVLSLEHSAPVEIWREFLDTGKKVTSHIAYNKSEYQAGLSKGAHGSMIAAVSDIMTLKV